MNSSNFHPPKFNENSFNCPFCNAYSQMRWSLLHAEQRGTTEFYEAYCTCCEEVSIWKITKFEWEEIIGRQDYDGEMVYPFKSTAPIPDKDMPEDVKVDYLEASDIFSKSPRGAAALLRLALQKLCRHLGEPGKNINDDIRSLSAKKILPPLVVNVADTVRITGNNAVHPGEMSDEDFDQVASKLFELLNFIVRKGISEPEELKALYNLLPEGPRKSAEKKDARATDLAET